MRKYEISCTIIIQALSQIKAMYKDDWEVLVGNCDSFLFLGGADETSLKYVSEMLGKETIRSVNSSRSYGKQGSHSLSYNKTGRELLTTSELRVMDNENCVLFVRGLHPFFENKYPLEKHPNYRISGDGNPDFIFDVKERLETGKSIRNNDFFPKEEKSSAHNFFEQVSGADIREAELLHREHMRELQMRSAKNRKLHHVQPLRNEFPGFDKPPEERTPEENARIRRMEATLAYEDGRRLSTEEQLSEMFLDSGPEEESHEMFHKEPDPEDMWGSPESEMSEDLWNIHDDPFGSVNNLSEEEEEAIMREFNQQ